jgi:hypothetical protein
MTVAVPVRPGTGAASFVPSDFGTVATEPFELYRAKSKDFLTSHLLADFRKCPDLFRRKRLGLIPDEDRPAFVIGRAAHTLVLEGRDKFAAEYAVGGPINPKTGALYGANTKAWHEWAEAQGKPALPVEQVQLIERLRDSVRSHPAATVLLEYGLAEAVVRTTYCDMPCQIRMDWFDPYQGIVDLKTCDDLTWFEADAKRYGYAHQLAFYRAVLAQRIGLLMPVHLIAVEKKEPLRTGVWKVDAEVLSLAQRENVAAMERLKRCQADDVWPTGYEEIRPFDVM